MFWFRNLTQKKMKGIWGFGKKSVEIRLFFSPASSTTSLMHISSVFFAFMDMEDGPRIVYQVPENLITAPKTYPITPSNTSPVTASADPTPRHSIEASLESNQSNNNNNNTALAQSRTLEKKTVFPQSPMSSVDEESPPGKLFEFELVSQFVVPRPEMCGRLTICTTRKHRIVGFPVLLKSDYYFRKMFQFNLGFVFHRDMDVSCYEPVVRKVARVLTTCEVCLNNQTL